MTRDDLDERAEDWKRRFDAGEVRVRGSVDRLAATLAAAPPSDHNASFMDPVTFEPMTQAEYLRAVGRA